jgi:DNA-binding NarL/FixJ family response regulator
MAVRVLVADDQALLRAGFRLILAGEPDLEVVGDVADGNQAIEAARRLRPDVILMDIRMPGLDGLEATRRITTSSAPAPRVIILTTYDLDEYVFEALEAGASGFLLKDAPPSDLLSAIRAVASGDAVVAPSTTRRLLADLAHRLPDPRRAGAPADPALDVLTPRESEVLVAVARGLSNAEIARELVLAEATVKTHVGRILAKLELRDRVQLVVFAYDRGLVAPTS